MAEKLGRKWIATDLGKFGIHTTRKRLIQVQRELKKDGKAFRAFEVLNLGCYERQAYLNISPRLSGKKKAEALTKHWTDWVDYWAVDFDCESRKEIIQQPKSMGVEGEQPGVVQAGQGEFIDFEERWTGAYIFENEWQSFRTRKNRELELTTAQHTYAKPGRYTAAVKVIDIFGNDTMTLIPVNVG